MSDSNQNDEFPSALRFLLSHADARALVRIRKHAYKVLREICGSRPLDLTSRVRVIDSDKPTLEEDILNNLSLAYLDAVLRGRTPRPSTPARDDRPATPSELLTEILLAVVDKNIHAYTFAALELAELATRGQMPSETELELPR